MKKEATCQDENTPESNTANLIEEKNKETTRRRRWPIARTQMTTKKVKKVKNESAKKTATIAKEASR